MPTFTIKDNAGRTLKISGDSEPTEDELEELFGSMQEPEEPRSEFRAQATVPDSLQLTPQFDRGTMYGRLAQPPPEPEFLTRAEAEGGTLGDSPAPRPPRIVPGEDLGSGYYLPKIEDGDDPRAGQEIKPQGKFSQFIEETAQAPVRIGMMRRNDQGEYETEMGPTEVLTGDEWNPRSHTALAVPLPSDLITKYATKEGKVQDVAVGLRNAAAGFLNFFLSPQGEAMGGMGSASKAPMALDEAFAAARAGGDMRPFLSALRQPANRGLAGAFAVDMAKHAPEALAAGDDAMKRGDLAGAIEHWAGGASQLALAGLSAKHAAMPSAPRGQAAEQAVPPKIEAERPSTMEALTPDETSTFDGLRKKFFEGADMTPDELTQLDTFDARRRSAMMQRVEGQPAPEGMIGEAERLLNESVKSQGISDRIEIVDPAKIDPGSPMSGRIAQFNLATGKIQINGRALVEDLAKLPEAKRKQYLESAINEEAIHSRTSPEDALNFLNSSTWAERQLNKKIYSGNFAGESGGRQLTDIQLGFEMMRRRAQHLARITPTEIAREVGARKWTVQSLDILDRSIAGAREFLGTDASKSQIALLDKLQKNVGIAKDAASNLTVGTPRKEVDDLVSKLNARKERVTTDEAVDAGLKAESIEDLEHIMTSYRQWKQDMTAAREAAKGNPAKMMEYAAIAQRGQIYREAIEAATNLGSHKVAARVGREVGLPEPKLDATKNPDVAEWVRENGPEIGISAPEDLTVGAPRNRDNYGGAKFGRAHRDYTDSLERIRSAPDASSARQVYDTEVSKYSDKQRMSAMALRSIGARKTDSESIMPGRWDFSGVRGGISRNSGRDISNAESLFKNLQDYTLAKQQLYRDYNQTWESSVGSPRGIGKREAERIEEQRKYRELMLAKETKGKKATVEEAGAAMSRRMAAEPITPDAVGKAAGEVLSEQVPSFNAFVDKLKTRHGTSVQPGQVAEAWADAVWSKLQNASGAELEKMVNDLGLRRQVFGKIQQGSKTLGLPDGPPPVLTRSGKIADAGIDTGGVELARSKAMDRATRLSKRADELQRQADRPITGDQKARPQDAERQKLELKQKAEILRRTASNLEAAAKSGEGMPAKQTDLFGGEEAVRPTDFRDPVRGGMVKARDRAISAIARHLLAQRPSLRSGLGRKSVGPEDVRWESSHDTIQNIRKEDLQDLNELGYELTRNAATDASTKRVAGGGRYVVKEEALPRSATKKVVALLDKRTKKVYLVSAFRDGRRGPVFLDPLSVTGEHRSLADLTKRFHPMFGIPLDAPVQNFKQEFSGAKEFNERFYGQLQEMSKRVGWRGYGTKPNIEGTEGLGGQGGLFMGPEADLARAETGMVEGAREVGADLTPQEGRALYQAFSPLQDLRDVEGVISGLRQRATDGKLSAKDWLVINGMNKINEMLIEEHREKVGDWLIENKKGKKDLGPKPVASIGLFEETLNEIYHIAKLNETERSFTQSSQRQFAEGHGILAEAGKEEVSPTARELTMLKRRPPTDISRAEPGQPEVPTGADPNRPAGLPTEPVRQPPGVERQLYKLRSRERRIREGAKSKREYEPQSYPASGAPTPEPTSPTPERKARITRDVNQIADRIANPEAPRPEPPAEPAGPQQGEMTFGTLRRVDQRPGFWEDKWKDVSKSISDMLGKARFEIENGVNDQNFFALKSQLNGLEGNLRTLIRETGLQIDPMDGLPVWETVRSDKFNQAAHFVELLERTQKLQAKLPDNHAGLQTDMTLGSLRRNPGRTLGEKVSNLLTDFGSIYDKWMVDRLDEHGGPVTKNAVRGFRGMIDRQKELYGQLTPLLDRARRLSGGIEENRGTNLRGMARDLPRQARESINAQRGAAWMSGLRRVTADAATARVVDAVEGNLAVPPYAQRLLDLARSSNLEIGRMLQAVIPGFVASGRWQRNLTGLGYDIIRSGGGPLWDRWVQGMARANRMHGASRFAVESQFRALKEILDDPLSTSEQIERVNQDMARLYPNVITHVKQAGRWQEVVHSNLFNYLEQTAQRATHVRAFREQFPATDAGRHAFRTMVRDMKAELTPEVQRDLDGLIRAINGHPTDEYGGGWQDYLRLGPQQTGGAAMRMMNQTVNNILSRAVLTGQMVTQMPEMFFGATPQKLGYRTYLRAVARAKQLYTQLELTGAVNRVMHDYTFSQSSPVRSLFRMGSNATSKVSMQAMLNELQEALAAATARITTEDIVSGRMSDWQKRMLPQTFKEMGFNPAEVQAMMRGDQTLLGEFQRKASSFLTGGNKSIAEGSRLGANRLFNSVFRFQTYPMMKMNQARNTITTLWDAWNGGTRQQRIAATESAARFFAGNAMQGAALSMFASLMFGGTSGLMVNANEAKDEPFKFLGESFLASMGGPLYILWRGARQGGIKGVGEQGLRAAFPYAVANEMQDMWDGAGKYKDKDTFDKLGTFVANKTPGLRMLQSGAAMFGLGNESQALDQAMAGFRRWRVNEQGFRREDAQLENDERAEFRKHVLKALDAMKDGDTDRYVEEWLKAVDAKDQKSFRQSMERRKILVDVNGAKLTEEMVESLQKRIGMDAYNRLEWYDMMLEAAANGAIPQP